MIRPFLIALQFLTRLPVRLAGELEAEDLGRSLLLSLIHISEPTRPY